MHAKTLHKSFIGCVTDLNLLDQAHRIVCSFLIIINRQHLMTILNKLLAHMTSESSQTDNQNGFHFYSHLPSSGLHFIIYLHQHAIASIPPARSPEGIWRSLPSSQMRRPTTSLWIPHAHTA